MALKAKASPAPADLGFLLQVLAYKLSEVAGISPRIFGILLPTVMKVFADNIVVQQDTKRKGITLSPFLFVLKHGLAM